jgi:hypothetical protein
MYRLAAIRVVSILIASSVVGSCGGSGGSDLTEAPPEPLPVVSVRVTPATATIEVGSSTTLTATLRDASGDELTDRAVTWSSDRENLAPVSGTGAVTAAAPGLAIISARSEGKVGTAVITVTPVIVASVAVLPEQTTVSVGRTVTLEATAYDGNGNRIVGITPAWTTSSAGVATAVGGPSGSAIVTGVAQGTASITATVAGKSAVAAILVVQGGGGAPTLCQQIAGASLFANDGQYLGQLANEFNSESIYNEFGTYGSEFSATSIYNEFGQYGGEFASLSPFNEFTSTPPRLIKDDAFLAYFTVNEFKTPAVNPHFAETCQFF